MIRSSRVGSVSTTALDGTTRGLDWSVGLAHGENKVENRDRNYYDRNLWNEALGAGLIDATTDTNDPAFVDSLKVSPIREGNSKLTTLDGKVSGELFEMRGGPMRYAVGASWWKEDLSDNPDPLQIAGLVVGSIQQTQIARDRVPVDLPQARLDRRGRDHAAGPQTLHGR